MAKNLMTKKATTVEQPTLFHTGFKTKQILKITRKRGYQIVKMLVDDREYGGNGALPMRQAFTPEGWSIGDPKMARMVCERFGIKPQYRTPRSNVCTIGYSSRRRKWYGWSHRAIAGFGLGSVVRKGDVISDRCVNPPLRHSIDLGGRERRRKRAFKVGYRPKTMADCKRMAMLFAEEVS